MSAWKKIQAEFRRFLDQDRGVSAQTLRLHLFYLDGWVAWLRRRIRDAKQLRPQHVDAYLAARRPRRGRSSLRALVGTLRVFLRFLRLRGILSRDLSALVVAPREYALQHVPRFLTADQTRAVLARIDSSTSAGLRDKAMVALMLGLGLRRCEVAALRLNDLDVRAGGLRVPPAKGSHARSTALTPFETEPIEAYLQIRPSGGGDDRLFLRLVGRRRLEGISPSQISCRIGRYLRAAGIERGGGHRLRHTFAQHLADRGAPLEVVQKLLGHGSGQTTEIYTKVRLETLREVAENDSIHF